MKWPWKRQRRLQLGRNSVELDRRHSDPTVTKLDGASEDLEWDAQDSEEVIRDGIRLREQEPDEDDPIDVVQQDVLDRLSLPLNMQNWSPSHVCRWLAEALGMQHEAFLFRKATITGHQLLGLTSDDLAALGIEAAQRRTRLLSAIRRQNMGVPVSPPVTSPAAPTSAIYDNSDGTPTNHKSFVFPDSSVLGAANMTKEDSHSALSPSDAASAALRSYSDGEPRSISGASSPTRVISLSREPAAGGARRRSSDAQGHQASQDTPSLASTDPTSNATANQLPSTDALTSMQGQRVEEQAGASGAAPAHASSTQNKQCTPPKKGVRRRLSQTRWQASPPSRHSFASPAASTQAGGDTSGPAPSDTSSRRPATLATDKMPAALMSQMFVDAAAEHCSCVVRGHAVASTTLHSLRQREPGGFIFVIEPDPIEPLGCSFVLLIRKGSSDLTDFRLRLDDDGAAVFADHKFYNLSGLFIYLHLGGVARLQDRDIDLVYPFLRQPWFAGIKAVNSQGFARDGSQPSTQPNLDSRPSARRSRKRRQCPFSLQLVNTSALAFELAVLHPKKRDILSRHSIGLERLGLRMEGSKTFFNSLGDVLAYLASPTQGMLPYNLSLDSTSPPAPVKGHDCYAPFSLAPLAAVLSFSAAFPKPVDADGATSATRREMLARDQPSAEAEARQQPQQSSVVVRRPKQSVLGRPYQSKRSSGQSRAHERATPAHQSQPAGVSVAGDDAAAQWSLDRNVSDSTTSTAPKGDKPRPSSEAPVHGTRNEVETLSMSGSGSEPPSPAIVTPISRDPSRPVSVISTPSHYSLSSVMSTAVSSRASVSGWSWCRLEEDPEPDQQQHSAKAVDDYGRLTPFGSLIGKPNGWFVVCGKPAHQALVQSKHSTRRLLLRLTLLYAFQGDAFREDVEIKTSHIVNTSEVHFVNAKHAVFGTLAELLRHYQHHQEHLKCKLASFEDPRLLSTMLAGARDMSWCQIGTTRDASLHGLDVAPAGAFIIRTSQSMPGKYVLTAKDFGGGLVNRLIHPVEMETGVAFVVAGTRVSFHSLQEIVDYVVSEPSPVLSSPAALLLPEHWRHPQIQPATTTFRAGGDPVQGYGAPNGVLSHRIMLRPVSENGAPFHRNMSARAAARQLRFIARSQMGMQQDQPIMGTSQSPMAMQVLPPQQQFVYDQRHSNRPGSFFPPRASWYGAPADTLAAMEPGGRGDVYMNQAARRHSVASSIDSALLGGFVDTSAAHASWFRMHLDRHRALANMGQYDGQFVVRSSTEYFATLTVFYQGTLFSNRIQATSKGLKLLRAKTLHMDLSSLIEHYSKKQPELPCALVQQVHESEV